MLTYISLSNASSVKSTGSLPRNSGIMPNSRRSSVVTCLSRFGSSSYLSLSSALKPMDACLLILCLMISSISGNAPPHINSMFLVLMVVMGTIAFLLPDPTGTSTSAPSSSFNSPCCTDSPLTSLLLLFCFLAILSISSMNTIPLSAFSTSLSAAARSFDRTLSTSSPI